MTEDTPKFLDADQRALRWSRALLLEAPELMTAWSFETLVRHGVPVPEEIAKRFKPPEALR